MQKTEIVPGFSFAFKELLETSALAVYTCDKDGYITFFNQAAADLWGTTPETGKDLWCGSWKIYYPDGKPMPLGSCPMALTLKQKKSFSGEEIVIERPDNTFRNVIVYPSPVLNDDGDLIGACNILVDITEHKNSEEKQAILSAIVESSDDAIISKTLDGIITSWNKSAQKIFGYTEQEVIGKPISILIPTSLQSEEKIIIQNIKAGNKIDHYQTVRLTKSGREVNISLTVSPIKDRIGKITGASKIARDITEHLQKEQAIQQNAQRLEILNSVGKGISVKSEEQFILQNISDATTKITGAAFGVFFYNSVNEFGESCMVNTLSGASGEAFENFEMPSNTAVFHPVFQGEGIVRVDDITKDPGYEKNEPHDEMPGGHPPAVSYLAVPVISASGEVFGGLFLGHPASGWFTEEQEDIVKSIASQASVALDNSRLFAQVKTMNEKKDEFIALASHELKTPLTIIKGYLQILQQDEMNKTNQLFFEKTLRQVENLNNLVSELLDVSKADGGKLELVYETFDLRKLLLEVIEVFHYNSAPHTFILQDDCDTVFIEADKQRIEQAITNLITNAVKYSPKANKVFINLNSTNTKVTVAVKDEGIGLSPEQQKKVFTKFYRTEGNNISGLGLGLYITQEIITRHKGEIYVKSKLGEGAEFYFSVPLVKQD